MAMKSGSAKSLRVIQIVSWLITAIFLVALAWAVYQAVVNGATLPLWAWLGLVVVLAVAIGLIVAYVVYRAAAGNRAPLDFSLSTQVTGELQRESRQVEVGAANTLRAHFKMLAGSLKLSGGATDLMNAEFTYDDADWRAPTLDYSVDESGEGDLSLEQTATGRPAMRQGRCDWVIRLNQDVPTDLEFEFGAGKAELSLAGLTLNRLGVQSGVGELMLDLSGDWQRDLEAFVRAGIGDTTIRLPVNLGVRVLPRVGLGRVDVTGLTWDGEAYTNALYGQSEAALELVVEGGMGKIHLELAQGAPAELAGPSST